MAAGFACSECGNSHSSVIDSRGDGSTIRRRRQCDKCGQRWTTYEVKIVGNRVGRPRLVRKITYDLVHEKKTTLHPASMKHKHTGV